MKKSLKLALITVIVCLSHIIFINTAVAQAQLPASCTTPEADDNGDGLIEICYLEDLNAIRFQLDGTTTSTGAIGTTGCPDEGCDGFELIRDLDFNDPESYRNASENMTSWTTGEGWQPIGASDDPFLSRFEGGYHTISGLMISITSTDTSHVGLFSSMGLGSGAEISNLGLLDVDITAPSTALGGLVGYSGGTIINSYVSGSVSGIEGADFVGGLAGDNEGEIRNSYATASVLGFSAVGGLVGENGDGGEIIDSYATGSVSGGNEAIGGLVGENVGTIMKSYATGSVSGGDDVGGLVGHNEGAIRNSYATGSVVSPDVFIESTNLGGLVGLNDDGGSITNSYATGFVSGVNNVGGLVGESIPVSMVTSSYWDTETSGIARSDGGAGRTTSELQSLTMAAGIYSSWSPDVWEFDEPDQYPMLIILPASCNTADIVDDDSNGLIEICYLEDLDAMRFVLDGSGYQANSEATMSTTGCPNNVCTGYELVRDLDFNKDHHYSTTASRMINQIRWTTGEGWEPVGSEPMRPALDDDFTGDFEGNDFTISNLMINREINQIGLFGYTGRGAEIANVGLLNVNTTGNFVVGGLVGHNQGSIITNSYVMGSVSGNEAVGGLVGRNNGTIENSYATGSVSGNEVVGGLVGSNGFRVTIENSYASSSVSGGDDVGGLVGNNSGNIMNSYARGSVSSDRDVGGLVGFSETGSITDSYWDIFTSGITEGIFGIGQTPQQLQSPTMASGIYENWSTDDWDFGTPDQYPVGRRHINAPRSQPLTLVITCAPFFPNIGQTELFFRINRVDVNENGLTIDNHQIASRELIKETSSTVVPTLKVTLDREIVADTISVSYRPNPQTTSTAEVTRVCSRSSRLSLDTDQDGIIDAADNNPFDEDVRSINISVASTSTIASLPTTSTFYSRSTIIRSLLRDEGFTYIDDNDNEPGEDEFVRKFIRMTPAQYFGIDPAAKIFRQDDACVNIRSDLPPGTEYHLNKIRVAAHCMEVTSLADEPVGAQRYNWATVDSNGFLTSELFRFDARAIEVLPEINFSDQQDSYLYTTIPQDVVISSYHIDEDLSQVRVQRGRINNANTTPSITLITGEDIELITDELDSSGFIAHSQYITANAEYPQPGETITHWLDRSIGPAESDNAWHPAHDGVEPQQGGVIERRQYQYAIGAYNNIDVRLAASDEEIARIRQVRLHEVIGDIANPQQATTVSSVVVRRSYYLVADYEASTDTVTIVRFPMVEGYTMRETSSTDAVEAIRNSGGAPFATIIAFTVSDDSIQPPTQISVGWDRIGSAERVIETYLVNTDEPINYREPDTNNNNIPDNADLNIFNNRLQAGDNANVDYLSTQRDQPVFLTYEALVIANDIDMVAEANSPGRYSAADIEYGGLSPSVRRVLGFDDAERTFGENTRIERLAAFGIRDVDYQGVRQIDDNNEVIGGITHVVFPMSSDNPGEIFYIGKYNRLEERWERFERGTFVSDDGTRYLDTWYVIERPGVDVFCPTNVEVYKNGHQAAGEEGQGFVASVQNCIMLVITDGGPYDSSGLDGRVVDDMVATVNELLPRADGVSTNGGGVSGGGSGSGGGGTIGVGYILLLLGALALLITATNRTRRSRAI